jgi:hypothetical protein
VMLEPVQVHNLGVVGLRGGASCLWSAVAVVRCVQYVVVIKAKK